VVAYLRTKQLLLILDNFEQVTTGATVVSDLLAACPGLVILVTSRTVLRLSGEYELAVPPLPVPPPGPVRGADALQDSRLLGLRAALKLKDGGVTSRWQSRPGTFSTRYWFTGMGGRMAGHIDRVRQGYAALDHGDIARRETSAVPTRSVGSRELCRPRTRSDPRGTGRDQNEYSDEPPFGNRNGGWLTALGRTGCPKR
jgi:hypothetical protein